MTFTDDWYTKKLLNNQLIYKDINNNLYEGLFKHPEYSAFPCFPDLFDNNITGVSHDHLEILIQPCLEVENGKSIDFPTASIMSGKFTSGKSTSESLHVNDHILLTLIKFQQMTISFLNGKILIN